MIISNHKLLKFRILSPIVATIFAVAVYAEVKEYFMFPLVFLQLAALVIAIKFKYKKNEKSVAVISRGASVLLITLYVMAMSMGVMVAIQSANLAHSIAVACFYVVILDAIMAIPFVLSFTNYSEWQRVRYVPGTHSNHADSQMFNLYDGSGLNAHDSDTYWHQSPHYTASSIDSSPDVNPASGLIMVDNAIDVAGNFYGFNDHSFSNDISQTNQFSDYDYHNNN